MKTKILELATGKASKSEDYEDDDTEAESTEDEGLEAFREMAKAIRDGDDEAAFQAFKDAMELC